MNAILQLPSTQTPYETLADLVTALGDVPLSRIHIKPAIGTATEADVIALAEQTNKILCELIDGVLVEKGMGSPESFLAGWLITHINNWIIAGGGGRALSPDGMIRLSADQVRMPDVSYFRREQFASGRIPREAIWSLIPDLAVEILSPSNRPGEMQRKREDYFTAGVRLVWEIDPVALTVTVYTSLTESIILSQTDTLTGGDILPRFTLSLTTLFAEIIE